MVADALNEPSQSITEACEANNVGNLALESVIVIISRGVCGVGYDNDRNLVMAY